MKRWPIGDVRLRQAMRGLKWNFWMDSNRKDASRVQVAVPVSQIPGSLTYAVPAALVDTCVPGVRVRVRVAGRRVVGVVTDESPSAMLHTRLRLIEEVIDEVPVITSAQIAVCRFVSEYYFAPLGESLRLVLPPDTPRDVKARYRITQRGQTASVFGAAAKLREGEQKVLAGFEAGIHRTRAELLRAGLSARRLAHCVEEGFLERVDGKSATTVRKTVFVRVVEGGQALPVRAPALAELDRWLREQPEAPSLDELRVLFPSAKGKVAKLCALGRVVLDEETRKPDSSQYVQRATARKTLTPEQQHAVDEITTVVDEYRAFLLEGVTGAGKTEVYLRALEHVLAKGQGALIIVPEISLTPQLVSRVQQHVGVEVAVLHSGLSVAERRDALARLREGFARVAIGARSALFAPMPDLGLIIVDEEHDASLKQDDTPRYHGRDVALFRAKAEHAVCVLGSATPSLESKHNVTQKKLVHLSLTRRIGGGGRLPKVELVDLRERKQFKEARARDQAVSEGGPGSILSAPLVDAIRDTLAAGEQVLLFLNRRGYASFLLCEACGEIHHCPSCSVALTLHKGRSRIVCHQCDHEEAVPEECKSCRHGPVLALGLGTERVEAEVRARFPESKIARLDRDTTRTKGVLRDTLEAVRRQDIDVLIGTQMIAKGHDFPGISLVGVVLADVALAMPDFRASERAFALLTQVAGRAGRGEKEGRVIIQTYNPEHPALVCAVEHDVTGFCEAELQERAAARYPPFWRATILRVEGEDENAVDIMARRLGAQLREWGRAHLASGTWDLIGPAPAPIERLRGAARHHLFLRTVSAKARGLMLDALRRDSVLEQALSRTGCRLVLDVDPVHVL